jgi:hypothetical protein
MRCGHKRGWRQRSSNEWLAQQCRQSGTEWEKFFSDQKFLGTPGKGSSCMLLSRVHPSPSPWRILIHPVRLTACPARTQALNVGMPLRIRRASLCACTHGLLRANGGATVVDAVNCEWRTPEMNVTTRRATQAWQHAKTTSSTRLGDTPAQEKTKCPANHATSYHNRRRRRSSGRPR